MHRHGQMGVRKSSRSLDSPPNRAGDVCAPVATTAASLKLLRTIALRCATVVVVVVELAYAADKARRLASCHEVVIRQHSPEATSVPEVRIVVMPCRSTMWDRSSVARLCGWTLGSRKHPSADWRAALTRSKVLFVFIPTSLAESGRRVAGKQTGVLSTRPSETCGRTWTMLPATLTPSRVRRASSARQWSTIAVVHSP